MNVMIFGATGMVGQSVLRECLNARDVQRIACVGRSPTGLQDPRLVEVATPKLPDLGSVASQLAPFDACFFCLGVSSVGMSEGGYTRITHDLTLGVAGTLAKLNPSMTFTYVSGAGTDSSAAGPRMGARVKGRTENGLLQLPFKGAYMFRPGVIQPLHEVRSKTPLYRAAYAVAGPVFALLRAVRPSALVTSVEVGLAMLSVARRGYPRAILEVADIQAAARQA